MDKIKQVFAKFVGGSKVQHAAGTPAPTPTRTPEAGEKPTRRPTASMSHIKGADALHDISYPATLGTVVAALEKGGASKWTIEALKDEEIASFASPDDVARIIGRTA